MQKPAALGRFQHLSPTGRPWLASGLPVACQWLAHESNVSWLACGSQSGAVALGKRQFAPIGEVRSWHADKGRYAVWLPTGKSMLLKPENLKPAMKHGSAHDSSY